MRATLLTLFLPVFFFGVSVLPASAQSQSDIVAALERMDSIIAEMEKLRVEFESLSTTVVTTPKPTVLGVQTTPTGFTLPLEYGATNDDIKYIQSLLATDPEIYPYGVASGFFGPKTQEAIRNLQARFGLDPVGVVGPATRTILEAFKTAFPTGAFPDNVLEQVPTAPAPAPVTSGGTTSPAPTPTPKPSPAATLNPIVSIEAEVDRGEAEVFIEYRSKNNVHFIVTGETKEEIARSIVRRTDDKLNDVLDALSLEQSSDEDEDEAEDRLEEIEDLLDEVEDEIEDAEEDGDDIDEAEELFEEAEELFEEAEDEFDDEEFDEVLDLLEEAEELLKDALDELGIDSEEDEAKEAIKDAEDAIEDAEDAIEEADDDGEDVDDAEDLLDEAKDLLEEAEEAFDDEDFDDAIDLAEEAEDLAKDAEDEL